MDCRKTCTFAYGFHSDEKIRGQLCNSGPCIAKNHSSFLARAVAFCCMISSRLSPGLRIKRLNEASFHYGVPCDLFYFPLQVHGPWRAVSHERFKDSCEPCRDLALIQQTCGVGVMHQPHWHFGHCQSNPAMGNGVLQGGKVETAAEKPGLQPVSLLRP